MIVHAVIMPHFPMLLLMLLLYKTDCCVATMICEEFQAANLLSQSTSDTQEVAAAMRSQAAFLSLGTLACIFW